MTRLAPLLIATLVAGTVLPGCRLVNRTERAEPRATPTVVLDERVSKDRGLGNKAEILQVIEGRTPNGLLRIQVQVENTTKRRADIKYQYEWFSQDGMNVRTPLSDWRFVSLAGKEQEWLTGTAPTPDTVDFQLKLIEAR